MNDAGHPCGTHPNSSTHPRMIKAVQREKLALERRLQGWSFEEIANDCGYADRSAARKAVMRALDHTVREPIEEAIAEHLARLDDLVRALHPERHKPPAARVIIQALDQRAKITGLYAPEKVAHQVERESHQEKALAVVEAVEEWQKLLLGEAVAAEEIRRNGTRQLPQPVGVLPEGGRDNAVESTHRERRW